MILNRICSAQRAWSPPTSLCSIQDLPQVCRLRFAKRVIIESGLIYTTVTLILFINHVCQSEGKVIAVAAVSPLISNNASLTDSLGDSSYGNCFQFVT
jgi:hypothetical protein